MVTEVVAADAPELPLLALELTLTKPCHATIRLPSFGHVYRKAVVPGAHAVQLEIEPPFEA